MDDDGKDVGYLIQFGEDESLNAGFYKLSQTPINWIYKGRQHHRDANCFYDVSEKNRVTIFRKLEEQGFRFEYFFRNDLTEAISKILEMNPDVFLPDFDAFYYLMHLSVENTLKGLWLDENPHELGFTSLPKILHTHNLNQLAAAVDLELSKLERQLLEKFTNLAQSYCRYPIKTKSIDENSHADFDLGNRSFETVCFDCLGDQYTRDKEKIEEFMSKYLNPRIITLSENQHGHLLSAFGVNKPSTD